MCRGIGLAMFIMPIVAVLFLAHSRAFGFHTRWEAPTCPRRLASASIVRKTYERKAQAGVSVRLCVNGSGWAVVILCMRQSFL